MKPSDESRNFLKLFKQDSFIHALTFFIHESARLTFEEFKQFQEKPSANNNHNNHHHQQHKGLICSNQTLTEEINKKNCPLNQRDSYWIDLELRLIFFLIKL